MAGTSAIIPASGLGKRLGSGVDKAFAHLAGRPLVAHTLSVFQDSPDIDEIVLVARAEYLEQAHALIGDYGFTKVNAVVEGGKSTRQESVYNGLSNVSPNCNIVVIHDGARPFVTEEIIAASIQAAREDGAAIAAVPVVDTIKLSEDGRFVSSTPDRKQLYAVQTPQTFTRDLIESAYKQALEDSFVGTDDASLVEHLGRPVRIVAGSYENIKITNPVDIATGNAILMGREGEWGKGSMGVWECESVYPQHPTPNTQHPIRVGHGYDIHRFAPGRRLVLGGVEFPGEEGLLGHSDADVLLHAVSDAILGAAAAGDIGRHFPDTDPTFKDASSMELLKRVGEVVNRMGWRVGNIDVSLIAQRPRIAKHVPDMQANIARMLGIDPSQVSVKGRTAEGLGPIGEGLGIECHAVVLLHQI